MSNKKKDFLLLVVRLIIGGLFIATGWMKVSAPADTVAFFSTLGMPAFVAYVVGYAELIGGIAIVLGFWTNIVSIILAVIMIGAIYFTRGGGFSVYGLPLVTFAGLLSIIASGPGRYALRSQSQQSF